LGNYLNGSTPRKCEIREKEMCVWMGGYLEATKGNEKWLIEQEKKVTFIPH